MSPELNAARDEATALTQLVSILQELPSESRDRLLRTVMTFFGNSAPGRSEQTPTDRVTAPSFSEDRTPSAKDFMFEKRPQTDVERIACLAYYVTHYRDQRFFKTLDLSKLNTEAAQLKFSNAAVAVDNAAKAGFLVQGTKGSKQLSALGELYVQSLPDREAAKSAIAHARPKRRSHRNNQKNNGAADSE